MDSSTAPLQPTFEGHVSSTYDALILFEACLSGQLNHVPRRPHDRERQDLIRSGSIFIYEEHASGIKRWTDGVSWSPSRILGNFLIYRELDKPFPPGEKKRALKKNRKPSQGGVVKNEYPGSSNFNFPVGTDTSNAMAKDTERSLIGSLIDSYSFKNDGLIKKTISVNYQGVPHHLVSYYNVKDVMNGALATPAKADMFRQTTVRPELWSNQNFRTPVDEVEYGPEGAIHPFYPGMGHPHDMVSNGVQHYPRTMSIPNFSPMPVPPYGAGPYQFPHQQASFVNAVPSSMAPHSMAPASIAAHHAMTLGPASQNNYALDPSRTTRFVPSSSSIASGYDPSSQHGLGLEESGHTSHWAFDTLDGPQDQQHYYNGTH